MTIEQKIEGLLLWHGEPVTVTNLAKWLATDKDSVRAAIKHLEKDLAERGIVIIQKDEEVTLGTHPSLSATIEKLTKEELGRELGRAGLETLTIILYHGPVSRADIDYIRGVNSSFIVRHLLVRGLIERLPNPNDARGFVYRPTFELLAELGITKIEDLPDYDKIVESLKNFTTTNDGNNSTTSS